MADEETIELGLSNLTVQKLYDLAVGYPPADPEVFQSNPFQLWSRIFPDSNVETIGRQMDCPPGVQFAVPTNYWYLFKLEFHILLCTKDKRYASTRKAISRSADKSETAIVSIIAAAIASSFGIVAGTLVPVCAICLIALLKMGKEVFCLSDKLDVRVGPDDFTSRN